MLRKSRESHSDQSGRTRTGQTVVQSIESDDAHSFRSSPQDRSLSRHADLNDSDIGRIYYEWINAGKPHHFVCSKCYQPENLLGCGTCCRSYHVQCLPLGQGQEQPCSFHCPSCKSRAWDQAPPRLPASVVKSQDVTPVASTPASTDNSPLMARHNLPVGSSATLASPQEDDYERAHPSEDLPSISELYPYVQAYLAQADAPGHQSEFQHQIAGMLHEAESYRILLRKVAALREEFTRVQTENIQLKAYLNSRVPTREPVISSPSTLPSYIPRPSSDTDGKSWDSIVLDLI